MATRLRRRSVVAHGGAPDGNPRERPHRRRGGGRPGLPILVFPRFGDHPLSTFHTASVWAEAAHVRSLLPLECVTNGGGQVQGDFNKACRRAVRCRS